MLGIALMAAMSCAEWWLMPSAPYETPPEMPMRVTLVSE